MIIYNNKKYYYC